MLSSTTIEIAPVGEVVFLRSGRARRLRITVVRDGTMKVTVPRGMSVREAKKFFMSRIEWVQKHLEKIRRQPQESPGTTLPPVDRAQARRVLAARLNYLARKHGFSYNKLFIRNQKTKWGTCSGLNNIGLNMSLAALPQELQDYVILHELVHLEHKNHSRQFWQRLEGLIGDAKKLKKQLRNYAPAGATNMAE